MSGQFKGAPALIRKWQAIEFNPEEKKAPGAFLPKPSGEFISSKITLQRRANAKYLSVNLANELVKLQSPLNYQYRISQKCGELITLADGKLVSSYCGYRWCTLCNRIRTAKLIDKYTPYLDSMKSPHFITLTLTNCKYAYQLKRYNRVLLKALNQAFDMLRKYGIMFQGFRKLEITTHPETGFHPHVHFILDAYFKSGRVQNIYESVYKIAEWDKAKALATFEKTINADGAKIYHIAPMINTSGVAKYRVLKKQCIKENDPNKLAHLWVKYGGQAKQLNNLIDQYEAGKVSITKLYGELLILIWMYKIPRSAADIVHKADAQRCAQDIRPATPESLKELFKYSTKQISKTDTGRKRWIYQTAERKGEDGKIRRYAKRVKVKVYDAQIHIKALDEIYISLSGTRTLQPIGWNKEELQKFNAEIEGEINEDLSVQDYGIPEEETGVYTWNGENWQEVEGDKLLTEWQPSEYQLKYLASFVLPNTS